MNSLQELITHYESILTVLKQAQADIEGKADAVASKEELRKLLLQIDGLIEEDQL